MLTALLIILMALLFAGLLMMIYILTIYNRLLPLRSRCKNALAVIDVHLKRRHELVSDLVEALKTDEGHSEQAWKAVADGLAAASAARQGAAANPCDPAAMRLLASSEAQLGGVLRRLLDEAGRGVDSAGDPRTLRLHEELVAAENKVTFACETYQDVTTHYNQSLGQLSTALVARILDFHPAAPLEIEQDKSAAPVQERR